MLSEQRAAVLDAHPATGRGAAERSATGQRIRMGRPPPDAAARG